MAAFFKRKRKAEEAVSSDRNLTAPGESPPLQGIGIIRQLIKLLTPKERQRFLQLIPAIAISAVIEVLGVATVNPFLSLVADPGLIKTNRLASQIYTRLGFTSNLKFLLFVGILMFAFIVIGKILSMITTWGLLRFCWMRNHTLSMRLLRSYLDRPYIFFLSHHSADMMKNLMSEVQNIVQGGFLPAIDLLAQGTVAILILVLLVVTDPLLALSVGLGLGGSYALIYALTRRRMHRLGKSRLKANLTRYKIASDTMGGIKELKLLNRERTFLREFRKSSEIYAKTNVSHNVVGRLPRMALEAIAFGGIVLVVLYLLKTRGSVISFLPIIGLYAIGSIRLLPALQLIFSSLTTIRFHSAALEAIVADLPSEAKAKTSPLSQGKIEALPFTKKLTFHSLGFSYPGAKERLFNGLNLTISAGSSVGIVGETGSGKSTLVDILLGLLSPDSGYMEADEVRITGANVRNWQANLGYVPQQIFLSDDTVAHNIAFAIPDEEIDSQEVERAARAAQIHKFIVKSLPQGYDTFIGEKGVRLSGGQRQRLGIARALYSNPELIVFDEATSALDSITEDYVYQAIAALAAKKTIIIIAHRLSTVEMCDVIYVLDGGKIVDQGSYEELYNSNPQFRALAKHRSPKLSSPPKP